MNRSLGLVAFSAVLTLFSAGAQAAPDPVGIQLPADPQAVNLGAVLQVPITVTASSCFNGKVTLSLDLGDLSQTQGTVSAMVNPQEIQLSPGETAQATVTIKTDSMAPTLSSAHIGVIANTGTPARATRISSQFSLSVNAIFEIRLYGGPVPEYWDSPTSVSFAAHSEGVLVRFINMDTRDSHVIHSEGPIPHGDIGNPLQPASAQGQQGGIYEYLVTGTGAMDDSYHCHTHESDAQTRILHFNQ